MRTWICSRGATLSKFAEHGKLWVADQLPVSGISRFDVWQVTAAPGDTLSKLITKWLKDATPNNVPHARYSRETVFMDMVRTAPGRLVLVVDDAHHLKGHVIEPLRLLAEEGALVVLVGDPARIEVATQSCPGFNQRALYCVRTETLFAPD